MQSFGCFVPVAGGETCPISTHIGKLYTIISISGKPMAHSNFLPNTESRVSKTRRM